MVVAQYEVQGDDVERAAMAIAIGQSVGNPNIRASRDTPELLGRHQAKITSIDGARVTISFPAANFGQRDGIAHLLAVLLGGQMDVDYVLGCRLVDVDFGSFAEGFSGPRYGIEGIREIVGAFDRPLIGGIVKPKLGLTPHELAEVCLEMADGGVDFIKEDEVLGDPQWCPLTERVPLVATALSGYRTIYAPCVTADGAEVVRRAQLARDLGATAIHLNIWSGFGAFRSVRELVDIPLFFQKSGDRLWTSGPFSMSETVLYKIVRLVGCDFAHVGMWGGYLDEPEDLLWAKLAAMRDTTGGSRFRSMVPSFSCGAHPGLVPQLADRFGVDIMISSGGAIHGHPMGTKAGARAFRQALGAYEEPTPELDAAVALWGSLSQ